MISVINGGRKNIVVKGENAGNQHFLLLPQCYQRPSSSRFLKLGIAWEKGKDVKFTKVLQTRFILILLNDVDETYKQAVNPSFYMPILGFSNSAANKDMMLLIWTNEVTVI